MKGTRATIRYAKALLQLSVEKDFLSQSYNDMIYVDQLCSESKDFVLLLKSPIVKTDLKLKIINEVLSNKISETSLRFINIITSKKRESLLPEIVHILLSFTRLKIISNQLLLLQLFPCRVILKKVYLIISNTKQKALLSLRN